VNKKETNIVEEYLDCLRSSDTEGIRRLFSPTAVVHSPLYGEKPAYDFYDELFKITDKSDITLRGVFMNPMQEDRVAAHFEYTWRLSDDSLNRFECVDIFDIRTNEDETDADNKTAQIERLTIIYDTHTTRPKVERVWQIDADT